MTPRHELQAERLLLRPYRKGDWRDVLAYASDEEWAFYSPMVPHPYTKADAEAWVEIAMSTDWNLYPIFAVEWQGRVIGSVSLSIDISHGRADLAFGVARERWGIGLATEAVRTVLDWAFRECNLGKVFARTDQRNLRSWRLMERIGMRREGVLLGHRIARDGRQNEVIYGLLKDEWSSATEVDDLVES